MHATVVAVFAVLAVASAQIIPHEFVTVFKKTASDAAIQGHMEQVKAVEGSKILFEYNFGSFRGYSVRLPVTNTDKDFAFFQGEEVDYYEPNQVYSVNLPAAARLHAKKNVSANADCNVQREATWGLVRIAQDELNINGLYPWSPAADGRGVSVYVIDTGIYLENQEFQGRAVWGFDAVESPSPENDPNGHGTHCAGTVMSAAYGVSKTATAIAVRVLGASGSGSTAGVIAGVQYVAQDGAGKKSVASMSLGGGFSPAMNQAVAEGVAAGIPFVVAAGNEARDACTRSPASEPTAITVMCSDSSDSFCYFSNYGTCANIIAPGMSITSTWIGSPYAVNTISGTSMSTPHVAGHVANLISGTPDTLAPATIKTMLTSRGNPDKITGVPTSIATPNVLLYQPCV